MTKNFKNPKIKTDYVSSLPQDYVLDSDLPSRCKFNFSYIDINQTNQDFLSWNNGGTRTKLVTLMDKLRDFSRFPLSHWERQRAGRKKGHVLEVYGDFPENSAFQHPKHVPVDVAWGRFRIDSSTRLAGFVVPREMQEQRGKNDFYCDGNTFYVVFLDENHEFYR